MSEINLKISSPSSPSESKLECDAISSQSDHIHSEDELISEYEPIAHDLRLTFSDQDKDLTNLENPQFRSRTRKIHRSLIDELLRMDYITNNKYTSGYETQNKSGDRCSAHIHLRFYSRVPSATIRRKIKRYLTDVWDQTTKGNKYMMFKGKTVSSIEAFWYYCLKQNLDKRVCGGFTDEQLEKYHSIAKESWFKTVQIRQAKMDKADNLDTMFSKIMDKLKKDTTISCQRDIARIISQFYLDEEKPLNDTVIKGYTTNASIKLGFMTMDEYLSKLGY